MLGDMILDVFLDAFASVWGVGLGIWTEYVGGGGLDSDFVWSMLLLYFYSIYLGLQGNPGHHLSGSYPI